MKVEIVRDWLDYVQAVGVLLSFLLAGAALVYARKSAKAADESAQAAATTAAAATQEAAQTRELVRIAADQHGRLLRDLARRPVLSSPALSLERMVSPESLTVGQIMSMDAAPAELHGPIALWPAVLRAAFLNQGDKTADQVLARILVPLEVGLWRSRAEGKPAEALDLHREGLVLVSPKGESASQSYTWRIAHLPPGQPEVLSFLVVFRDPGDYAVELQLEHEEAEPAAQRFRIRVPDRGIALIDTT